MKCVMVVAGEIDNHFDETLDEARVFFRSFNEKCRLRPTFIIHTTKKRLGDVMDLAKEYERIEFTLIDESRYEKAGKSNPRYYKLEAYDVDDDNVFVFDTDLIVIKSIDNLFGWCSPIAMVKERARDCFNSGLVQINRRKLGDVYRQLLSHPHDGGFGNDQNILNSFFKGKIKQLDNHYNELILNIENLENVSMAHLILKPWYDQHIGRCNPELTENIRKIYKGYGGQY